MANKSNIRIDSNHPTVYQIRIRGHLGHPGAAPDEQWSEWFGGLTLTNEDNGDTLITGPVADQAALYGLLRKVRDLGMPLLSVNWIPADRPDSSDDHA